MGRVELEDLGLGPSLLDLEDQILAIEIIARVILQREQAAGHEPRASAVALTGVHPGLLVLESDLRERKSHVGIVVNAGIVVDLELGMRTALRSAQKIERGLLEV